MKKASDGAFLLFSQSIPSHALGFIDSKSTALEVTINGQDLTITQSPGVLSSNRAGGTTGAVVWKVTPPFATWLASPDTNLFFKSGVLSSTSTVLELGCGVSALVGLAVGPLVSRYVLSDQPYVSRSSKNTRKGKDNPSSSSNSRTTTTTTTHTSPGTGTGNIIFRPLDWETDTPDSSLAAGGENPSSSFDFLVACDCIYNEALIPSFTQTCADVCRLRSSSLPDAGFSSPYEYEEGKEQQRPCVCVVAQQLRDPEVFEAWLREFRAKGFRVWRVPDGELPEALRSTSGFVVHVGILQG
ncbi:hypothetical protein VMCG_02658 [Cytospora schulzeri]|uniref:Diaminohydroxyphosphoribosylamino-pyrimidine deaminase n=1 Tax=Cytospora schulzeri TaxID=448051 RepID=A0A423X133_9PEZI|nr:hypothetical protein VMCG_02658 [Valsa malicola]